MKYLIFFCLVTINVVAKPLPKSNAAPLHTAKTTNCADDVCPDDVLCFAQTLIGTPYHSAASDPSYGFDCSGFVSYVFKNFNFDVPRSSRDFINVGEKVDFIDAKPGDIILFTGTSTKSRKIGHVGIVMSNNDNEVKFIHSTSGKEHGVTITTMDNSYKRRFVQIIRMIKNQDV